MTKVAIHQPNFLPWMGLFHRLAMVDRFVVFDHVQAMGGRSWLSRNRILIQGAPRWLTLPVLKAGRLGQAVTEVEIDYQRDIVRKHLRTLELSYIKCPHGPQFLAMAERIYNAGHRYISEFNTAFIKDVSEVLGLKVDFVSSTTIVADNPEVLTLAGNDLVLAICRAAGGEQYFSGEGCTDFIHPAAFERNQIEFYFQKFVPPAYPQRGVGAFASHLSVFDALCNIGADGVRKLIEVPSYERPAAPISAGL